MSKEQENKIVVERIQRRLIATRQRACLAARACTLSRRQ